MPDPTFLTYFYLSVDQSPNTSKRRHGHTCACSLISSFPQPPSISSSFSKSDAPRPTLTRRGTKAPPPRLHDSTESSRFAWQQHLRLSSELWAPSPDVLLRLLLPPVPSGWDDTCAGYTQPSISPCANAAVKVIKQQWHTSIHTTTAWIPTPETTMAPKARRRPHRRNKLRHSRDLLPSTKLCPIRLSPRSCLLTQVRLNHPNSETLHVCSSPVYRHAHLLSSSLQYRHSSSNDSCLHL